MLHILYVKMAMSFSTKTCSFFTHIEHYIENIGCISHVNCVVEAPMSQRQHTHNMQIFCSGSLGDKYYIK